MNYCYCLFCETKKCQLVANALEKAGTQRALSPKIIKRQRRQGKNIDILFDLLPGYVFAYSSEPVDLSAMMVEGVIRVLGCPECGFCLQGYDLLFANKVFETDGLINAISIIQIGDVIHIDDPLFAECNAVVRQIDYRKKRAKIELKLFNANCFCWVACDVINTNGKK